MSVSYVGKPLVCRELVGREVELARLVEAVNQSQQGLPQLVLLAGEAGLGKTRLSRELVQVAAGQGALVLTGQASLSDRALPFGLFLDAFRRYYGANPSQPSLAALPYLLRMLPELAPLFPNITPHELDSSGSPAQQQSRLFHDLLNVLRGLAASQPVVVVLEDLHWSDDTSLELLAFLARQLEVNGSGIAGESSPPGGRPAQNRLMLLGSYRSDMLNESQALSRLLVQLANQRQLYEVKLAPLSAADHARLLAAILGQPVSEEYAGLLFQRDEGNPFYAEELIGAMVAAGQIQLQEGRWRRQPGLELSLPLSLKASITERLVSLPEADQEVLAFAAVIGREFDFDLLADLTGLAERELLAVLRRSISLQLIAEDKELASGRLRSGERYQFRHALTREAIYTEMLTRERRSRHRAVAEALEKRMKDEVGRMKENSPHPSSFAEGTQTRILHPLLAEHYWQAGLAGRAAPYALQEARRAAKLLAFREERYYLQIVLAAMDEANPDRLPLLERLGTLSLMVMEVPVALDWLRQAIAGYRQAGQPRRAAVVQASMSFVVWFFDSQQLPALMAELGMAALTMAGDPDPASQDLDALTVYAQVALSLAIADQHSQAAAWVTRSLELAESLEDPRKSGPIQLCGLATAISKVDGTGQEAEAGLAAMEQALNFGQQHNLPELVALAYSSLASSFISLGYSDRSEQILKKLSSQNAADSWESGSLFDRLTKLDLAWQCYFAGDWEQGINLLRQDIAQNEQAGPYGLPTISAVDRVPLAHFLTGLHQLEEARACLDAALPKIEPLGQFTYMALILWGYAKLSGATNQFVQAAEYYDRVLALWKTTEDTGTIIPVLLDGVKFFVDRGNLPKSRAWLDELRALAEKTGNRLAQAAWLEAESIFEAHPVLGTRGGADKAIQGLRLAVEAWAGLRRRPQQAAAATRLAALLLEAESRTSGTASKTGRAVKPPVAQPATREEADRLLSMAAAEYERLGMPVELEAVEALRRRARLDIQHKRRSTLEEARRPFKDLTRREMQVLLQLAAGLTNKEIGTTLQITEGTVELHVNHILAKLDCDTRTQAAAYAIEQGWAKPQLSV
jgi:DNA-binding CsgD family transcriptional regulator